MRVWVENADGIHKLVLQSNPVSFASYLVELSCHHHVAVKTFVDVGEVIIEGGSSRIRSPSVVLSMNMLWAQCSGLAAQALSRARLWVKPPFGGSAGRVDRWDMSHNGRKSPNMARPQKPHRTPVSAADRLKVYYTWSTVFFCIKKELWNGVLCCDFLTLWCRVAVVRSGLVQIPVSPDRVGPDPCQSGPGRFRPPVSPDRGPDRAKPDYII